MPRVPAASATSGSTHMDAATQALCFFYRNPPPKSGVKPQPYKAIPKLIHKPDMKLSRVKMVVSRFLQKKKTRGRKTGWRKTTAAEDASILATFKKVRQPLGSLVEARDVWKALRPGLWNKISVRTVANRLRAKGYKMEEKLAGDDKGEQWRKQRVRFCKGHQTKTAEKWAHRVQAVADFRYFVYYPRDLKSRHIRKSAPRTIMRKSEKKKPARHACLGHWRCGRGCSSKFDDDVDGGRGCVLVGEPGHGWSRGASSRARRGRPGPDGLPQ